MICPLCDSSKKSLLSHAKNYKYYKCSSCKSIYLCPQPKNVEIADYYHKTFSYAETDLTKDRLKKRAEVIVNKMLKMNPRGGCFLDIGVGHGYFLHETRKHNAESVGVEPSEKLYEGLKDNYDIHNQTIEHFLKEAKAKFDFINLSHIIEHVSDPETLLRGLNDLLNENGIIYIETPNADSWLAIFEGKEYVYLTPPEHLIIFSTSELLKLCVKTGYRVKVIETYDYPEHVIGTLQHAKKYVIPDLIRDPGNTKTLALTKIPAQRSIGIMNYLNLLFGKVLARIFSPVFKINHKGAIVCIYITKY